MKKILLLSALVPLLGIVMSCENKEDTPVVAGAAVIAFDEEAYTLEVGPPAYLTGTITAGEEITSVAFTEQRGNEATPPAMVAPARTDYRFAQIVTPSTATTGLTVVATTKGGATATATVPITARSYGVIYPLYPGHYKVQSYTVDGVADATKAGGFWDITETAITINCIGDAATYTYCGQPADRRGRIVYCRKPARRGGIYADDRRRRGDNRHYPHSLDGALLDRARRRPADAGALQGTRLPEQWQSPACLHRPPVDDYRDAYYRRMRRKREGVHLFTGNAPADDGRSGV
jgi:hypothetical protein